MRLFLSAGEASGDIHGAELISALRRDDRDLSFTFLGGDLMAQAAQTQPLIHYSRMAYMGFSEVLRHLPDIAANLRTATQALASERPDALILIDYPGFNIKLAKRAWKLGIPVYWYISPKVWAWKSHRIRAMRRYLRHLLCILPFEPAYFARKAPEMKVSYVGNPSVEEIDRRLVSAPPIGEILASQGISAPRPILALVPGSRLSEIRNNLPIMSAVANRHPELSPVIAGAPGIDPTVYDAYSHYPVVTGATFPLMAGAAAALVTSGTATLECALAGTPQVVCYRANGSRISYSLMKSILHISYVSLPNLIADEPVIPEMLLHRCNPDLVDAALTPLLPGGADHQAQLDGYRRIRSILTTQSAAATAADIILTDLNNK